MRHIIKFWAVIFIISCGQQEKVKNYESETSSIIDTIPTQSHSQNEVLQQETHQLNLDFKIDSSEEESSKFLTIYRDKKKILTHTIFKTDGDCSSINIELGNYKINGNQIIFYTYWAAADRQNIALFPFGFRKQIFVTDEKGKLTKLDAKIFIENYVDQKVGKEIFY